MTNPTSTACARHILGILLGSVKQKSLQTSKQFPGSVEGRKFAHTKLARICGSAAVRNLTLRDPQLAKIRQCQQKINKRTQNIPWGIFGPNGINPTCGEWRWIGALHQSDEQVPRRFLIPSVPLTQMRQTSKQANQQV